MNYSTTSMNPKYCFGTFIVGKCNQQAYDAAMLIACNTKAQYNPLYIYGDSGCGKTHLLQSIAHEMQIHHSRANIVYVSGENFISDLIYSIVNKSKHSFNEKYNNADILLFDEIQFLREKEATQEYLFFIFDYLIHNNKQIVVSADRLPEDFEGLSDRIKNSLESGHLLKINNPDIETREEFVRKILSENDFIIPNDVINLITLRIFSNIRKLESSINLLKVASITYNIPVTIDMANQHLYGLYEDIFSEPISDDKSENNEDKK